MQENNFLRERNAARRTLISGTRRASDSLSAFSGWLMAGFGAAFALIVANVESVSNFVSTPHLQFALFSFLAGLVLAVVARWLAAAASAGVSSHDDAENLGVEIGKSAEPFDFAVFAREYERGLLPPYRWFFRRTMAKALAGDIVAGSRMIARMSQLQALLILIQALLAIVAAAAVALGLKV